MVHPFRWTPAANERHASLDRSPGKGYPEGMVVETLCGKQRLVRGRGRHQRSTTEEHVAESHRADLGI